ncbi:hypothetical protein JOB18_021465 [Solea senegalensis]|uniref:Uncharacterized protein n=1 Tax=Solea senegalensis TaxID=28829 RepID=A0AAV6RKI3_SOLSE|nr:hypothetical protein JOB18_021465 [Solea senegalensis]
MSSKLWLFVSRKQRSKVHMQPQLLTTKRKHTRRDSLNYLSIILKSNVNKKKKEKEVVSKVKTATVDVRRASNKSCEQKSDG